ncbi:hypothetical protein SELMODRAFT_441437 [Selaginella moellendorffii]|uniref:RRM domain-containing protein n=1 Tax=Selaginella moellendorffii TaxID=88036 RepID=D8RJJ4_SELML|nr:hypothetical protein SELMODRAFT_441437 [Selaginella moellendorffii]
MLAFQKRLERLAAGTHPREPDALAEGAPIFREEERSYSLIVRGISKKDTCPEDLQRLADGILRESFRFFPPCDEFVEKVFYCLHVDGDMGILVFSSELMAELLFFACCDETISPFSIAGKRFSLERIYDRSGEQCRMIENFLAEAAAAGPVPASKFVFLAGVPRKWEDADKLERYFNGFLESDFPFKVVTSVRVFPGAAYLECTSKAAIDRLFFRCEQDARIVTDIGQEVVICSGKILPLWRVVPGRRSQSSDASAEEQEVVFEEKRKTLEDSCATETMTSTPAGKRREVASSTREKVTVQLKDLEKQVDKVGAPAARTSTPQVEQQGEALRSPEEIIRNVHIDDSMECGTPSPRATGPSCRQVVWEPPTQRGCRVVWEEAVPPEMQRQRREFRLRQCGLVIGGLTREKFDSERVAYHFSSMLRKFQLHSDAEPEVSWRSPKEAVVAFSSENTVDRLLDNYMQFPEEFYLNSSRFWLSRPEGYHRPGAIYREGNLSTDGKAVTFDGLGVHLHREQLKGALVEAVERMLLKHGVVEKGKPLFKSFTNFETKAVAVLDEVVANALVSACVGLTVARRPLSIYTSKVQVTLFVAELPEAVGNTLDKLGQLLASGLAKMSVDHRSTIERIEWSGRSVARVTLRSEAAADALMSAYVNFTLDFCVWDMPLVIFRHERYVRPGATYRKRDRKIDLDLPPGWGDDHQQPELWQVHVAGIFPGLDPIPLMGAVNELLEMALAKHGILEQGERPFKRFYWQKGSELASLIVEEDVAAKLVDVKGLTLAGHHISFYDATVFREGEEGSPRRTGGWIEEEEK